MSLLLKAWIACLLVTLTMGMSHSRFSRNEIISEHVDPNELTPPQDPAINTFPKEPLVPVLPVCVHAGFFRDPFNCGKFYYCLHFDATPETYYCRQGLIFNEATESCDDPSRVNC